MMETDVEIRAMLSVAGEEMEFTDGTILGVPGTATFNVTNYDSAYEVLRQEFSFRIAYTDFVDLNIVAKTTFFYHLRSMQFQFEVVSFVNDLVGWMKLNVNLVETASV